MLTRHITIGFALAALVTPNSVNGQEGGLQLVGYAGKSDGALGAAIDPDRRANFVGAELVTNARGDFHWTFGVAHGRMTDANSCCGPTPTLSYHYHTYLPAAGIAYDFTTRPLRLRVGGSAGPLILRQSRSGTPPSGVGPGDPSWQWQFLYASMNGSIHYAWRDSWGILAGARMHFAVHPYFGVSESQPAQYLGVSWSWPRLPARPDYRDSLSTVPDPRELRASRVDTLPEDRVARTFSRVPQQARVRIGARGSTVDGRFSRIRADSVVVVTAAGPQTFAFSDITSAWRSERRLGRSTLRGAMLGGGITAVVAALLTWREPNCDYCINDPAAAAFVFAIPGTAVGAVAGHVVGWVHRPWRRIYP